LILLDTHAWLWWLSQDAALSDGARSAIEQAAGEQSVTVSTISTWELALLVARRRIELKIPVAEWVAASESITELRFLAPSNRIMLESVSLPGPFHSDPADRIIVATARVHGLRAGASPAIEVLMLFGSAARGQLRSSSAYIELEPQLRKIGATIRARAVRSGEEARERLARREARAGR
jgi:PIN domain nuclease of toxin-antitoxin system